MKCFSPFEGTLVLTLDFFFSDQHPGVSQPHYVLKKKLKKKKISTAHFCQFNASAVRSYLKVMKFSVIFT